MNSCYKILILIIVFSYFSCQNSSKESIENKNYDSCFQLNATKGTKTYVYTTPSPMQVASTLKLIEINYNDDIIQPQTNANHNFKNSIHKALCLGMCFVDLGYANINGQSQPSLNIFKRVDFLLDELDIQNQNSIIAYERFRDNINNSDSISKFIIEAQGAIDKQLSNSNDNETGVLILSGIFIEGLYIISDTYEHELDKRAMSSLKKNYLNTLLFQQEIFVDNLIDILSYYNQEKYKELIADLNLISNSFNQLKISFDFNQNIDKVEKIKLDNKKISEFKKVVEAVRSKIIS